MKTILESTRDDLDSAYIDLYVKRLNAHLKRYGDSPGSRLDVEQSFTKEIEATEFGYLKSNDKKRKSKRQVP